MSNTIPGYNVTGNTLTLQDGQSFPVTVGGFNQDGTAFYNGPNGSVYGRITTNDYGSASTAQLAAAGVPGYSNTPAPAQSYAPSSGVLGFSAWTDRELPFLGKLDDAFNLNPNTSGSITATNGPVASVGTFLSIVTNLPRMAAIIIGLILLIAGLFMLGVSPAVNIVGAVKDKAGL